jgi:hypothetical protein
MAQFGGHAREKKNPNSTLKRARGLTRNFCRFIIHEISRQYIFQDQNNILNNIILFSSCDNM